MNWYTVEIDITGEEKFLVELMDIINTCNDECQIIDCYSFAHICAIMDKLHLNSLPFDQKNLFLKRVGINAKRHLIIDAIFGSRSYSRKCEFQKDIDCLFEKFQDKVSSANFRYFDWP